MLEDPIETEIIEDSDAVDQFLLSWNLTRAGVLSVRDAAYGQLIDCSPLMAKNAPGTLAYHYGVLELRVQFLGDQWELCSDRGIEAIISADSSRKVVYQNVDIACSRSFDPKPRSEKGTETERDYQKNLFDFYGVSAPERMRVPKSSIVALAVMVDERGAVEVSRPVVEDGRFTKFVVRAFVSDGGDVEEGARLDKLEDPVDDFDVPIKRRV